jgi:hypothetical protein
MLVGPQGLVECIMHLESFVAGEATRTSAAVAAAVRAASRPINSFAIAISAAASTSLATSDSGSCNIIRALQAALDQLGAGSGYCCNRSLNGFEGTSICAPEATADYQELACRGLSLEAERSCPNVTAECVPAVALQPALQLHAAGQQLVTALSQQQIRLNPLVRAIADDVAAALADLETVQVAGQYVPALARATEAVHCW